MTSPWLPPEDSKFGDSDRIERPRKHLPKEQTQTLLNAGKSYGLDGSVFGTATGMPLTS